MVLQMTMLFRIEHSSITLLAVGEPLKMYLHCVLIKGVHKNAITMKIHMSTVIKVSITRRSCKISSVLFN